MIDWMPEDKAKSLVGKEVYSKVSNTVFMLGRHEGRYFAYGNVWVIYNKSNRFTSRYITEEELMDTTKFIIGSLGYAIHCY